MMMVTAIGGRHARIVMLAASFAMALAACCSEESGFDEPENRLPDTFISYGPSEESCNYYIVDALWYGSDDDGSVVRFEVAVVKGLTDEFLQNPDYDALSWGVTTATESTFVLEADSCCSSEDVTWYNWAYWGILVRSIDNEWARDPEPAALFFYACNVIPHVEITTPDADLIKDLEPPFYFCPRMYIEWKGEDPDGDRANLMYKYLAIPESDIAGGTWEPPAGTPQPWLPPLDHDSSGVGTGAPPIGYWSEWVPADCTYVTDLRLSEYSGTDYMVIFVTAKDEAGGVLPEQLFGPLYNGRKNWFKFKIGGGGDIPVTVSTGMLGVYESTEPLCHGYRILSLFSGTDVLFRFWAYEDEDRGEVIDAYRYYFDDPEDPSKSTWDRWEPTYPLREPGWVPEWVGTFPATGPSLKPGSGDHIFVVETKDYCGETTHCELHLEVLDHTASQPLIYLVDDNLTDGLYPTPLRREQVEDSLWAAILNGYNFEVFDTGYQFHKEVSPNNLSRATTVIWTVDESIGYEPQLLRVCSEYGNYLHSYVKTGGNLIIIGRNPIYACAYYPNWKTGQVPYPPYRASFSALTFGPVTNLISPGDTVINFNWDLFGIERMRRAFWSEKFSTLWPCEDGWEAIQAREIPGYAGWDGLFGPEFLISRVRDDIEVHKLYGIVPLDEKGQPQEPDCTKWLAVYVPGGETRGHAAYISIPPYLCDPDQVKAMIRHLLDLFGETPSGSELPN